MARAATKTANVYTRVDPETKEQSVPIAIGSMTKEQLDLELQKGMDDIVSSRVIPADDVEAEMRSLYGV